MGGLVAGAVMGARRFPVCSKAVFLVADRSKDLEDVPLLRFLTLVPKTMFLLFFFWRIRTGHCITEARAEPWARAVIDHMRALDRWRDDVCAACPIFT